MAGQTPQSEQVYSVYTEGQKADLTPHLGFDPAIGSPCKHGNCGTKETNKTSVIVNTSHEKMTGKISFCIRGTIKLHQISKSCTS